MSSHITLDSKIYIAGHNGMVGAACWRALEAKGYKNIIGFSSKKLDLRDQKAVFDMLERERPVGIIDAAARVGGILANSTYPYEFLLDNMLIQNNLINAAHHLDIPKFIFLGSSCIYPKMAPQPLKEEYLLTAPLEETNQWYAIAKISGVKLIEALRNQYNRDYVSLMPTNLYGPGDNYDLETSHVLPAMIRKFHEAKENNHADVVLWGTGTPKREFLHVDDLASAVVFALENKMKESLYNVGSGSEISIKELAELVQKTEGHKGNIVWDKSKPDGTPRKLMDSSKMKELGYDTSISL
ncbi:GDP-L-fucose synthase, partial [Flavobacteriaceae bacterium]|nr:GDP-L-fucose synthase [Flavobacteriaceae bacterium]